MKQHHITVYSGCLSSRMTVVISVVLAVLANNAKAESITHTFNFCADSLSVNTMTSPDNKQYSLISYQGLETLDSPGTPALPMITARFIVPTLSRNHKISVTQFRQSHHVGLDYIPYPSQDKCPNYGVSAVFTTPDMASYTASDGTPAVRIMDNALWDGDCRILTVTIISLRLQWKDQRNLGLQRCRNIHRFRHVFQRRGRSTVNSPSHQPKESGY